jgi:hypothetical protein
MWCLFVRNIASSLWNPEFDFIQECFILFLSGEWRDGVLKEVRHISLENNLPWYLPTSFDAELEVHNSNFERDTGYVCWELCGFLYYLQANFRIVFLLSHDSFLPNPYPIQYSPVSLPLDLVSSDIRTNKQKKKQTHWPQSTSELYRPSVRRMSAKLVPTFADRGCRVVSAKDPHGRILGFLDRSR